MDETLKYMQDAVELYIEDLIADGKPVPGINIEYYHKSDIEQILTKRNLINVTYFLTKQTNNLHPEFRNTINNASDKSTNI